MSINKNKVLSNSLPKKLLNRREAAEMLGVSSGTLAVWLCCKRYDFPYIKLGSRLKLLTFIRKVILYKTISYYNIMNWEIFWTAIASIATVVGIFIAYKQYSHKKKFHVELYGYHIMGIDVHKSGHKYTDIVFKISNPFDFYYILHEIEILYDGYWMTSSGNINTPTYHIDKPILSNSNLDYIIKMCSSYDKRWKEELDKDGWSMEAGMMNKTISTTFGSYGRIDVYNQDKLIMKVGK